MAETSGKNTIRRAILSPEIPGKPTEIPRDVPKVNQSDFNPRH